MAQLPEFGQRIELAIEVEFWAETGENEPERLDYRSDRWTQFIVVNIGYVDPEYFTAEIKCDNGEYDGVIEVDIDHDDWRPVQ